MQNYTHLFNSPIDGKPNNFSDQFLFIKIDEVLMKVDPEDANSETEDNINDLNSMDVNTAFETPDFSAFGLNDESFAPVKKYRDVVVGLMGQLQRTARAQDL